MAPRNLAPSPLDDEDDSGVILGVFEFKLEVLLLLQPLLELKADPVGSSDSESLHTILRAIVVSYSLEESLVATKILQWLGGAGGQWFGEE